MQFLEQYRSQHPQALILDDGDNFLNYGSPGKLPIITTAFQLSPYDVINLGDQDLAFAPQEYFKVQGIVKHFGEPILIKKGKTTYSILPVIHPDTRRFYPPDTFKGMSFSDPMVDIKEWLQSLPSPETFTVLLSHSGFQVDTTYAHAYPQIDLIVGGHSQTKIDSLYAVNGVPVVQAGGNAQYVGEIRFTLEGDKPAPVYYHLYPLKSDMRTHPKMETLLQRFHQGMTQ